MGFHTGNHLTGAEGFRDVVISPQAKPPDLINVFFLCGNHNNGGVFYLPDLPADFKAIHTRQHQIQDHQIKILMKRHMKSLFSIILDLNLKSAQLQIILLQLCYAFFIFHNQYPAHSCMTSWYFLKTKCISVPMPSLLVAQIRPP